MEESLFSGVRQEAPDPILSLGIAYAHDKKEGKVNLAVGFYHDESGVIPEFRAVHEARARLANIPFSRAYLPIEGIPEYNSLSQKLVLGDTSQAISENRAVTIQTLGGPGGLAMGAKLLHGIVPNSQAWISNPTWPNHLAIFRELGFAVHTYDYLDQSRKKLNFDPIAETFRRLPRRSIVLLHVCCHNPTGVDLSHSQWQEVRDIFLKNEIIPFLDFAYQGFGDGLEEDAYPVRLFAEAGFHCLISSSYSKSLSMYNERVGTLTVITGAPKEAQAVLSRLKIIVRARYSNPPSSGARAVAEILKDAKLKSMWIDELKDARERIKQMRVLFIDGLKKRGVDQDFSFITSQRGMFSMSGLPQTVVESVRSEKSIYIVDGGRVCFTALNRKNVDYVCDAIAERLRA